MTTASAPRKPADSGTEGERATAVGVIRRPWPLLTAVSGAVVVSIFGPHDLASVAVVATAFTIIVLGFVDQATHRLPNRAVLPLGAVTIVWLVFAAAVSLSWKNLVAALVGAVALGLIYLVLALIRAGGMGGGDVKLATVLGLTGGWYGLHAWTWVCFLPFFVGGLLALVGLASRRLSWTAHLPFGPALALGYCVAAAAAF